ncbi:hypothetical protein CFT12S02855_08860 [Campylobacter fetus subsp. testudinum]|nr:hypothetical protein CFT12S02855_08860 [Campylobacter fetus subsp. testudinum]
MYFIYFGKTAVYFYLNLNIETKYQLITIIYLIKIINYDIIAKKTKDSVYESLRCSNQSFEFGFNHL